MGLLDAINKLVSEHGSASIMKQRLELLKDQAAVIDKKLATAEAENQRLKKENQRLITENQRLQEEVVKLKAAASSVNDLPKEAVQLLQRIANANGIRADFAASGLSVSQAMLDYLVDLLEQRRLVERSGISVNGSAIPCYATPKGRDYLAKAGLL